MYLLSICIPTYNRSIYLKETLDSLVCDELFLTTQTVEVVISDNCSTDDTQDLCRTYIEKYGNKIRYHRQEKNIEDLNFIEVLRMASGQYAKLHNDNKRFLPGALRYMVDFIQERESEAIIFFGNGSLSIIQDARCSDLDDLLKKVGYFSTWIGGLCVGKDQFDAISDPGCLAYTKLIQVDLLCRIMVNGGRARVSNKYLLEHLDVSTVCNTNYSVSKVFGSSFLSILSPYVKSGQLSRQTYKNIRKNVFKKHILPREFKGEFSYESGDYFNNMREYWGCSYFYLAFWTIFIWQIKAKLRNGCPKWMIILFCIVVPKEKNRIQIREKYIKKRIEHV